MPADPHCCVLLRRVEALDGPAKVRVVSDVGAGFGSLPDCPKGRCPNASAHGPGLMNRHCGRRSSRARPSSAGLQS
jgi:hypothetical protein